MSGRECARSLMAFLTVALVSPSIALAQQQPRPPSTSNTRAAERRVEGYVTFGRTSFTATESFDAILGSASGPVVGGGARIDLRMGGLFFDLGATHFHADGERVFVFGNELIPLGIPAEISVTPIEISFGWRFRARRLPKLVPYVAGGLASVRYREQSAFASAVENDDRTFNGAQMFGGIEYQAARWLGVAAEAAWNSVPDVIGESGVSAKFRETNLGGQSFRVKILVGR